MMFFDGNIAAPPTITVCSFAPIPAVAAANASAATATAICVRTIVSLPSTRSCGPDGSYGAKSRADWTEDEGRGRLLLRREPRGERLDVFGRKLRAERRHVRVRLGDRRVRDPLL